MTNKIIDDNEIVLIYGLVDPTNNEVRYVGWTSVGLNNRLKRHMRSHELKKHTHKNHWINKLLKQGLRPEIIELEKVLYSDFSNAEKKWIAFYGRDKLTNDTDGGEGMMGWTPSEETKKKISKAVSKYYESPEAREINRKLAIKQWSSEENRNNLSSILTQTWSSEEKRMMASDRAKKRWENEDFRNNQIEKHKGLQSGENNPMYGKTRTEEERRKISEGRLRNEIKHTPETLEKISKKQLGRKKNRKDMTSLYMGVSKYKNSWSSKIRYNRKTIGLGNYSSELKAAIAYNIKSEELYGVDAILNIFDFEISNELLEEVKIDMQKIQDRRNNKKVQEKRIKKKSSKYIGISYRKSNNTWAARITFNGERIHLGNYPDQISAAKAYNDAALELFGWKAILNDIPKSELDALWLNCTDPTNELP
jgi:hypothetical protein